MTIEAINEADEQREDLKKETDRVSEYAMPKEGVVDIKRLIDERDELDALNGKLLILLEKRDKEIEELKKKGVINE